MAVAGDGLSNTQEPLLPANLKNPSFSSPTAMGEYPSPVEIKQQFIQNMRLYFRHLAAPAGFLVRCQSCHTREY